ncbi:MAG: hypothetical protein C0599_10035 [Salinivirgaceae bacterium]|nr:MAG: hypothetical protein C0599_10035 [Salinivirgaceae bacterium]
MIPNSAAALNTQNKTLVIQYIIWMLACDFSVFIFFGFLVFLIFFKIKSLFIKKQIKFIDKQ